MKEKDILKEYLPHDNYVVINDNDTTLRPIVLKLPDPPKLNLIDNYGLPKVEQKFQRREVPKKLQLIEKRARKNIEEYNELNKNNRYNAYHVQREFWRIIEDEKDSLEVEIQWIKHTWWFLRYGYWFYNYGKPTWIPPFYFHYLNFYYIDEAGTYPEYRDVDRRTEIFEWYTYTATETFKELDDNGIPISNEMIDIGHRVFFGTIRAKRRRGGATAQSLSKGMYVMTNVRSAYCDIVADTGPHAEGIFNEKLVPAWYHYPLLLKPTWDGDERPSKTISLIHPKTVMKEICLGSEFGYTKSSSDRANDSRKLCYLLSDEEGKGAVRGEVTSRWAINKETMAQDLIIRGFSNHPSTVEEMSKGGVEFRAMFEMSNIYQRKPSGQTLSGLLSLFTKAYDGQDGFIDAWGYSVINKPTQEQIKYAPDSNLYASFNKGAKQVLEDELATYLKDGTFEKLKEYRQLLRKKPMDSTDCWKGTAGDMGFNIIKIDKAIVDSKYQKVLIGNFRWVEKDTRVEFIEDNINGRWEVSDLFIGRANQWIYSISNYQDPVTGKYVRARTPKNINICTMGVDPFRSRTASQVRSKDYGENTNLSDGGGAIYLNPDSSVNGDLPLQEWLTPKFIAAYRHRPPTLDDYCEDMLMASFYYGAPMIGERNTETLIDFMIKRGYAGYLLYLMDVNGKIAPQPWVFAGGVTNLAKTDGINFLSQHIENHCQNESIVTLLKEWKDLSSPEDFHKKDLAAASMWAIYGYYKGYQRKFERINNQRVIDISDSWMKKRKI